MLECRKARSFLLLPLLASSCFWFFFSLLASFLLLFMSYLRPCIKGLRFALEQDVVAGFEPAHIEHIHLRTKQTLREKSKGMGRDTHRRKEKAGEKFPSVFFLTSSSLACSSSSSLYRNLPLTPTCEISDSQFGSTRNPIGFLSRQI